MVFLHSNGPIVEVEIVIILAWWLHVMYVINSFVLNVVLPQLCIDGVSETSHIHCTFLPSELILGI